METTKDIFRTRVEALMLSEMVADDRQYILIGEADSAAVDTITPVNTVGLFDDSTASSDMDDLEDLLGEDDDDEDLFS